MQHESDFSVFPNLPAKKPFGRGTGPPGDVSVDFTAEKSNMPAWPPLWRLF
jgi:hypothetical protein